MAQYINKDTYVGDTGKRLKDIASLGTTSSPGINKVINDLTHSSFSNGESLSAYQGYLLNLLSVDSVNLDHDNGYIKFKNGFMLAWKRQNFTNVPLTTAWGALYDNGNLINLGNWKVAFKETPITTVDIQSSSGVFTEGHQNVSTTSAGGIWLVRGTASNGVSGTITAIGVGRWK